MPTASPRVWRRHPRLPNPSPPPLERVPQPDCKGVSYVINDDMEVLESREHVGLYLELAPGRASFNILKMAREDLLFDLQAAINDCKKREGGRSGPKGKYTDRTQWWSQGCEPRNNRFQGRFQQRTPFLDHVRGFESRG